MMPVHRIVQFTDSWNTRWAVYEEAWAAGESDARETPRSPLLFMTDMVVRRSLDAPPGWWAASVGTLETLCNNASPYHWTHEAEDLLASLSPLGDLSNRTLTPPAGT